jgi:hypothetical protein
LGFCPSPKTGDMMNIATRSIRKFTINDRFIIPSFSAKL